MAAAAVDEITVAQDGRERVRLPDGELAWLADEAGEWVAYRYRVTVDAGGNELSERIPASEDSTGLRSRDRTGLSERYLQSVGARVTCVDRIGTVDRHPHTPERSLHV